MNPSGPGTQPIRALVLVVSDGVHAGTRVDESGPRAESVLRAWGAEVIRRDVVPDERSLIAERLREYADQLKVDLVVTSGGTGFAPRDVTPEATLDILEREAPGLAELMRRETSARTPYAALSRGVAGIRGRTLIVNLPGSPKGVEECLNTVRSLIPHAVRLLRDEPTDHRGP